MTDQPVKPTQTKAQKETNKNLKTRNGQGMMLFFSFALFIIICATLFFAFNWYNPKINDYKEQISQLNVTLNSINENDQQALLAKQIIELKAQLKQLAHINTVQNQSTKTDINKINQAIFLNKQQWLYSDIHYLLKLAVRRTSLMGDTKGAIAALQTADEEIRKIENAELIAVRKSIFETITLLKTVKEPDTEGLILKINHIKSILVNNKLSLLSNISTSKINEASPDISFNNSVGEFISQFFSIKDSAKIISSKEANNNTATIKLSEDYQSLLYIEKLRRSVLTMNQQDFNYYCQQLLNMDNTQNINSDLLALKSEIVGIVNFSADDPLKKYESYLEQLQQLSVSKNKRIKQPMNGATN